MYRRGHGLFILPALMFGGWIAIAVIGGVLGLVGAVLGGVFSGLTSLASGVFSGSGVVIGIVIGFVLYFLLKKRKADGEEESAGTVDGEAAETEVEEFRYRQMSR